MNSLQNRSTLLDKQYDTGQFSACIVTNIGKEMIAKSQNGQTLTFTRVALGDGLIDDDDDILSFTKVKNERLSANIAKWVDKQNGQFKIQFRVSNQEVEIGFWQREIGIMAKIDGGEEQLYAYATSGNGADFLYDKTTPIDERIVNIDFVIGNAENVQVIVNGSIIYATIEDLENAIDEHNADENAHDNLIKRLFGSAEATLDSIKLKIKEWAKEVCLPLSGGTMKGNINANGYNITATKFIGNLQGKADSATNADLATKANQDSQGQTINTTYVKGITASNATLTLTKGNGTTSTVTINNVGNSTKATQDSQGQAINTTYIKSITASNATLTLTKGNGTTSTVTINNVGNSTKATQDKNGKDITGYLYKTEDLTLNSNAEILTVGNISEILNSFCTKFKNIQGTASYGENSPTTLKSLNDNKAPKASPAFSGSPTTPTPSASDNSTKIPNTSWVQTWVKSFINNLSGNLQVTWDGNKYTIPSLGITGLSDINNGYISFGKLFGGLILQYGLTNSYLGNYPYAACNVNFPINFTKNYIIFAMHSGTQPVMINELYTSHTLSKTVLEAIAYDGSKSPNWIINWVAIGY